MSLMSHDLVAQQINQQHDSHLRLSSQVNITIEDVHSISVTVGGLLMAGISTCSQSSLSGVGPPQSIP